MWLSMEASRIHRMLGVNRAEPGMCMFWGGMFIVLTTLGICCLGVGCASCRHL